MTDLSSTARQRRTLAGAELPNAVVDDELTVLEPSSQRVYVNLRKQAKYIVLGGFGVWYFQVHLHARDVLAIGGWSGRLAILALTLLSTTVGLFGFTILLPARGKSPDYTQWTRDETLRTIIPLLTLSIVCGFITLVLTLSPLFAPPPPSSSLVQRLSEAASAAGSNLQSAYGGVQLVATEAAKSIGFKTGGSSQGSIVPDNLRLASLDTATLLRTLRLHDAESLATRLGVTPARARDLATSIDAIQGRASEWARNNVHVMGWSGAVLGSIATYLLVFGTMGLLGLFSPAERRPRSTASF